MRSTICAAICYAMLAGGACRSVPTRSAPPVPMEASAPTPIKDAAIVIALPSEPRIGERIDEEGHQPWRGDPKFAAMVELRDFVADAPAADTVAIDESYRILDEGIDEQGRPRVVVGTQLDTLVWQFRRSLAEIHMFRNEGGVWIATKIVVREVSEPAEGG